MRQDAVKKITNKLSPASGKIDKDVEVVDRVTLSESSKAQATSKVSKSSTSNVRRDLVLKFKAVLTNGIYEAKADEIADKIVQKIREQKDGVIF
jgi:anti-sigma28 factor (negative regulator of flagellin synthesis)